MDKVRVDKQRLLQALKKNLAKHEDELARMLIQYRNETITKLQDALEVFNKYRETKDQPLLKLPEFPRKPANHIDDYLRAIEMVEMSVDEIIELDSRDFSQLIMDEWAWKSEFELTKAVYGVR